MTVFFSIILILCSIVLLVLAIKGHYKVSQNSSFDDTNLQIDFNNFYSKLRKFVSNEQEKIYAVLGIKNAQNLLVSGIQENGFCILTDKAAYFIGKVHQKKWIFAFRTNVQHRIIASEMKGINAGTLSQFHMLICVIATAIIEMFNIRHMIRLYYYAEYFGSGVANAMFLLLFFCCIIDVSLLIYFVLHTFFLKRTNICIEFTSLTVAFLASELGKQEIKDFYKAVSEVQELYVNIANPVQAEHTVNGIRQSTGVYTNKVTSLSELSKLYENGMLTKDEFEQLKQEVIGSQQ